MDVRIGIVQSMKEIEVELPDDIDQAAVTVNVEEVLTSQSVLWLTDRKGRRVGIPASRIAYVEFGAPASERRVGFGISQSVRPPLRQRRLIFVTGKGGVGKTTMAAAMARVFASEGARVLLCSVDTRSDLASLFGLDELSFVPHAVDEHLSVMGMNTEDALRDYLKLNLRVPLVSKLGPLSAALDFVATAAPGVREILTIGKICYDVREARYDVVIVDAPATGHVVSLLAAPQALQELVRVGLIRGQTEWMREILADPERTGVVVVTTPEEMPVAETLELLVSLRTKTDVDVAAVILNRTLPELFTSSDHLALDLLLADSSWENSSNALIDAARVHRQRQLVAHEHIATLRAGLSSQLALVTQPFVFSAENARDLVDVVAQSLSEELP